LRQTSSVLYLAIDDLLPSRATADPNLQEFFDQLSHAGIPCVWLTTKTRLQVDEPRRKMGTRDPFIGEDGCGVFLPEDYFHLRPQPSRPGSSKAGKSKEIDTIRLGRFTCLPIAEQQPAASEALDGLASETGVSVVRLSSLPPRELAQNTGLHPREAEFARQRDFDELFFFAGASDAQVAGFHTAAENKAVQVRQRGAWWSLAVGASHAKCISELAKLYDRALHAHARTLGVALAEQPPAFFSSCDRAVLLTPGDKEGTTEEKIDSPRRGRVLRVPFNTADKWQRLTQLTLQHR
jgi:mannosyl-3-phosphoglycerate phosphatase